jgi:hypothetical protein
MSCYSVAQEIVLGGADYLVEQRGFEPMAIAARRDLELDRRLGYSLARSRPRVILGGESSSAVGSLQDGTRALGIQVV